MDSLSAASVLVTTVVFVLVKKMDVDMSSGTISQSQGIPEEMLTGILAAREGYQAQSRHGQ